MGKEAVVATLVVGSWSCSGSSQQLASICSVLFRTTSQLLPDRPKLPTMSRYSDYRKVESQFSDSRSSVENAEDEIYSFPQKPALSFSRLSFVLLILLVTFLSSGSTAVALGARPWRLWHMKPDFPLWSTVPVRLQ